MAAVCQVTGAVPGFGIDAVVAEIIARGEKI